MSEAKAAADEIVLIVDDEKNIRRTLRMVLEGEGYRVEEASSHDETTAALSSIQPSAILLDVRLGNDDGLAVLQELKATGETRHRSASSDTPVIMISGHATIDDAVTATRLGAFDFLSKPLDRNRVVVTVRNACERLRMLREVSSLRRTVDHRFELLGHSSVMDELRRQIAKVAPTKTRVLITGESGTGKELIARAIHRNSAVAEQTFVKVNCAAIPPELIESELFGHEKGAFTGATGTKRGLFEVADGGTIFLDEIGDMALPAQAKVLRVLQTGEYSRVGGEGTLKTDARVVAATNKDLEKAVSEGQFREDLFFRLNVVPIQSPPLRERRDDIELLARAFIADCCDENGFATKDMDDDVVAKLAEYDWPGNVRELRNIIERLVIMSDETITIKDLPPYLGGPSRSRLDSTEGDFDLGRYEEHTLKQFREDIETLFIRKRLADFGWNISRTAVALGIERTNLHKKMRALGIQRDK